MSASGALRLYVIYERPVDYPDVFVIRVWENEEPGEIVAIGNTLEEVRSQLPPGLYNLGRENEDESQIVEVWV